MKVLIFSLLFTLYTSPIPQTIFIGDREIETPEHWDKEYVGEALGDGLVFINYDGYPHQVRKDKEGLFIFTAPEELVITEIKKKRL